jgi:hypothetical protein
MLGVSSAVHTAERASDYVDAPTRYQFRRQSGSRQTRAFDGREEKDVSLVNATAELRLQVLDRPGDGVPAAVGGVR